MLWLAFLCCVRPPPAGSGSYNVTFGDDDDDDVVTGDDDDDVVVETGTTPTDTATTPTTAPNCDPEVDGEDCVACDQAGMWVPTRGLTGQALVDELNALTSAQFCTDYSAETTFMFVTLDKDAGGMVECVYTGREVAVGADKPDATDMNTEHTWPQSQGADTFPAECDLHHLYPTDSDTNSLRGNLPFGVVVSDDGTVTGGSLRGGDASGDTVFEPRDVHKGNVARSMAYFAMRYGYTLDADHIELFQEWGDADPVDEVELARTLAVGDRQGAPNPYVVCPMFLDEL